MRTQKDAAATAKAIIEANLYMVLGTADEGGRPWVSPVYCAAVNYREFFWVSRPETLHSRNLVARPEVSIVIFDSSVPIGTGQGVYMAATAEEVTGDARVDAMDVFSRRSLGTAAASGRSMT
jgi:nitroimidazol reductase NimA-like FMN-containing flavoprotein (pyridoxamine 5'-phosphate oxidase superfamily)